LDVNGVSYLVADFRIRCSDAQWNRYLPVAVAGVIAYPIGESKWTTDLKTHI
jgi:hypothetical protein